MREAASIVGKMQEFEFVLMLVVWHENGRAPEGGGGEERGREGLREKRVGM